MEIPDRKSQGCSIKMERSVSSNIVEDIAGDVLLPEGLEKLKN